MNELIADQLEWLLTNSSSSNRMGKQLITLVGFLADDKLPENISHQVAALSSLIVRQDQFDALVQCLSSVSRNSGSFIKVDKTGAENPSAFSITTLVEQIEAARLDVIANEAVNYSELIAWIFSRARNLKILKGYTSRR